MLLGRLPDKSRLSVSFCGVKIYMRIFICLGFGAPKPLFCSGTTVNTHTHTLVVNFVIWKLIININFKLNILYHSYP